MKKALTLAAVVAVSTMAMGLSARDSRSVDHGETPPHEAHFRYYEQIRPLLLGTSTAVLCNAEYDGDGWKP